MGTGRIDSSDLRTDQQHFLRLFVAVDLPEEMRDAVGKLRGDLGGAHWTPLHQLHLTLRFIGSVEASRLEAIRAALGALHCRQFLLQVRGTGQFPHGRFPRILWVGCAESEPLVLLRQEVEEALAVAGIPPEGRSFSPHITVARLRDPSAAQVAGWSRAHDDFVLEPFTVREFHLYSSRLSAQGATHRREADFQLEP
jgi:2'-5' RNA ligase